MLVAGPSLDAWSGALAEAGFEVRTPGWKDAITAARVQRPDAVVIADDLPDGATPLVQRAFTAPDVEVIPRVVIGTAPDPAFEFAGTGARYLPPAVTRDALGAAVRDVIRERAAPTRTAVARLLRIVAPAAALLAILPLVVADVSVDVARWAGGQGIIAHGERLVGVAGALTLLGGSIVAATLLAGAVLAARSDLPAVREAVGWMSFVLLQCSAPASRLWGRVPAVALLSAGFLAASGWALLGPKVKPRSAAARVWFRVLAVLAAALALLCAGLVVAAYRSGAF